MAREVNEILYDYIEQPGGALTIVKTQDCETILNTVHLIPDVTSMTKLMKTNQRYIGTIPNIIGLQWANEYGVRMFSREWTEVVKKKLRDPEFSKLKVQYQKPAFTKRTRAA